MSPMFAAGAASTATGMLYVPVNYYIVLVALLFGLGLGILIGRFLSFYEMEKMKT